MSCLVTGLTNGQNYRVSVVAVNTRGTGQLDPDLSYAFAVPVPVAPGVPVSVSGVDRGVGGTVRVSWVAPRDSGGAPIVGYRVEVSADGGATWLTTVEDTNSSALFTDVSVVEEGTPLVNGSNYLFRVSARNAIGWGSASAASRAVAPTGLPVASSVSGVVAANAGLLVEVPRLGLADAGGLPVSYRVTATHTSNTRSFPTRSCTVASSATYAGTVSCLVTGLTNGQTYGVSVVAVNTRGTGPAGVSTATDSERTPFTVTKPVDGLSWIPADGGGTLSWNRAVPQGRDAESYVATLYTSASGGSSVATCEAENLSCEFTSLSNDIGYFASVQAVNVSGRSPASQRVSIQPLTGSRPNDPYFSQQSNLTSSSGVNVLDGWYVSKGDPSVVVAVIDTGVNNHVDLQGRLVHGYDFWSYDRDAQDVSYGTQHGTHVAGIIAANANNGIGIAGVAPQVSIQPIRVLNSSGSGLMSDLVDGIYWASGAYVSTPAGTPQAGVNPHGPVEVINLSLGYDYNCGDSYMTPVRVALEYAVSRGVSIVSAAGNESTDAWNSCPASFNESTTVASANADGSLASHSNYRSLVSVAAPGVDIWSTVGTSSYARKTGTSMAAPHVAGQVALLRGQGISASDAQQRVRSSARITACHYSVAGQDGRHCGFGTASVGNSLRGNSPITPTSFTVTPGDEANWSIGYGSVSVEWSPTVQRRFQSVTYRVTAYETESSSTPLATCSTEGSSCAITGLPSQTPVYVTVRAIASGFPNSESQRVLATTGGVARSVPEPVADLTYSATSTRIYAFWNAPPAGPFEVTRYKVALLSSGGTVIRSYGPYSPSNFVCNSAFYACQGRAFWEPNAFMSLASNTAYVLQITAINRWGDGQVAEINVRTL